MGWVVACWLGWSLSGPPCMFCRSSHCRRSVRGIEGASTAMSASGTSTGVIPGSGWGHRTAGRSPRPTWPRVLRRLGIRVRRSYDAAEPMGVGAREKAGGLARCRMISAVCAPAGVCVPRVGGDQIGRQGAIWAPRLSAGSHSVMVARPTESGLRAGRRFVAAQLSRAGRRSGVGVGRRR